MDFNQVSIPSSKENALLALKTSLTEKNYIKSNKILTRRSRLIAVIFIIIALWNILIYVPDWFIYGYFDFFAISLGFILLLCGILSFVSHFISVKRGVKINRSMNLFDKETALIFYEDKIVLKRDKDGESVFKWTDVKKVYEEEDIILFHVVPNNIFKISDSEIDVNAWNYLRVLLLNILGDKKIKVKKRFVAKGTVSVPKEIEIGADGFAKEKQEEIISEHSVTAKFGRKMIFANLIGIKTIVMFIFGIYGIYKSIDVLIRLFTSENEILEAVYLIVFAFYIFLAILGIFYFIRLAINIKNIKEWGIDLFSDGSIVLRINKSKMVLKSDKITVKELKEFILIKEGKRKIIYAEKSVLSEEIKQALLNIGKNQQQL